MSKETAKSLFIVSSMPRLYQHLLSGIAGYEALGNRLVKQIKAAHAFRQIERVREFATILSNIPIREYQVIGQYYLVWYSCRESVYKAAALEKLVEQTRTYKANVLLSRAFIEGCQHKMEEALYFYNEALKTSPAISDYISVKLGIAQVKGIEGFHHSALKDIENLFPIIRHAEPRLFFDLLNSYATELAAIDKIDEARSISRIVLASPFISAYPMWRETAEDLKQSRRSFVAVGSSPYNVLAMPEREPNQQPMLQPKPARVLNLAKWKKKMDKKDKDQKTKKAVEDMTKQDLGWELIGLINENNPSEEQLRQLVYFAMTLFLEPDEPDPDKPSA